MNQVCKNCNNTITDEMIKNCNKCKFDLRSEIPNTDDLRIILKDLENQFEESFNTVQMIIQSIDDNQNINNQTEKSDYMDLDDLSYLIQDYRIDPYSPLMIQIEKLRDFKKILNDFQSTDYLNW